MHPAPPRHRMPLLRAVATLAAVAALSLAACGSGGGGGTPTLPPNELMTEGTEGINASGEGAVTSCVDSKAIQILQQMGQPGADAQTLLKDNQDALLNGLAGFDPSDPATTAWRDKLVPALEGEDAATVAAQAAMVASGTITLPPC